MPDKLRIMTVFGTRPEAIKMAPVVRELQARHDELAVRVVVTAQHREMLDQVLDLFQICPDHDLDIMEPNQTLTGVTSRVLAGLAEILVQERPDMVLVHGDTTTTFAAALAAFYHQIPVGHVEAGLRTGQKYAPFPEELNRRLAGVLADLHFAPTAIARSNLVREGIRPEKVLVTGNTVIDALLDVVNRPYTFTDPLLAGLGQRRRLLLVTAHRRENLGDPMYNIFRALRDIAGRFPDVEVAFPVHKNPKVRSIAAEVLGGAERIHLIEPLDYAPFAHLMARAHLVLTDSGGMQEEAPSLGKPVLVLRQTTERPEAVTAGTVVLVGTDYHHILRETTRLLTDPAAYRQMASAVNPYGDGLAAGRTVDGLLWFLGRRERPPGQFGGCL